MQPRGDDTLEWVAVKIMVPFWVPIIIRHLLFRDHNFDNYPNVLCRTPCQPLRNGAKNFASGPDTRNIGAEIITNTILGGSL